MSATIEHLWRTYTSLDLALLGSLLVGWLTLVAWCAVILDG